MSIEKYRDVRDMPPVSRTTGAALPLRIRATWARARRLAGGPYMVGVQKFTSLQTAQEARTQAIRARVARRTARGRAGQIL